MRKLAATKAPTRNIHNHRGRGFRGWGCCEGRGCGVLGFSDWCQLLASACISLRRCQPVIPILVAFITEPGTPFPQHEPPQEPLHVCMGGLGECATTCPQRSASVPSNARWVLAAAPSARIRRTVTRAGGRKTTRFARPRGASRLAPGKEGAEPRAQGGAELWGMVGPPKPVWGAPKACLGPLTRCSRPATAFKIPLG